MLTMNETSIPIKIWEMKLWVQTATAVRINVAE